MSWIYIDVIICFIGYNNLLLLHYCYTIPIGCLTYQGKTARKQSNTTFKY